MYLSHPVRRLREDPAEGETVTLRITAEDGAAADAIAERVGAFGTVHERLRFGGLLVTVPQPRLDEVCSFEDVESIETDSTLEIDADGAGEDVEYERERAGGQ